MTRPAAAASLLIVLGLVGCATDGPAAAPDREVPLAQRNDLALVSVRAADLRPGMSKAEVYALLGAPAEYGNGTWVYRGADGGELVVRFDGDRYTGHGTPDPRAKKR